MNPVRADQQNTEHPSVNESNNVQRSNGVKRWRRRLSWVGGAFVALALLVVLTPWPTQLLALPLIHDEAPTKADVMIILGAGTRNNPVSLPPQAQDRLREGKELWDAKFAPTVIVAGGFSRNTDKVESKYMKPFLASLGVPAKDIIEENQSLDTYQNAKNSLALMKKNDWATALIVTSSYHTWRGCRIFRKLEADVTCVSAPLDDHGSIYERWINFRSVIREYGAIVYYWSKDYI